MTRQRVPVDLAIERWLRALSRACSAASTSALIVQLQRYGCSLHGGQTGEHRLPGLVGSDYVVRQCSDLERRVLILRYWGATSEVSERDATGQAVESVARGLGYGEIGVMLGLSVDQVHRRIKEAREKVRVALEAR